MSRMSSADHRLFVPDHRNLIVEHGLFNQQGSFDAANKRLCHAVGLKLTQTYPGHPFGVVAEVEHGIVKICLQGFTQWPYVLKIDTLKSDPALKSVVKAGGELLERLRMPRTGFSMADWQIANRRLPHHFNRNKRAPE